MQTQVRPARLWGPAYGYRLYLPRNTRGADKSLARPGRKQATATKLGIYSTYSPRSSIHFLAHCSNFCNLLKKIQKIVRPTRSPRQQWPPRRMKNGDLSIVFSVQGTDGSPTGPDPENMVGDQDAGSTGRPVSSGLLVPGEMGHCRARTRPLWWPSQSVFPSKCPSIAPAEMSNTPRWRFGPLEDNQWGGCRLNPKKSRRELFQRIFALGILGGEVSRYAATLLLCLRVVVIWPGFVHGYQSRQEIVWIAPKKIPKLAQTTGTVDVFDQRSGILEPTSRRSSACPNLHEWWTQPVHVRCPVAQLLI